MYIHDPAPVCGKCEQPMSLHSIQVIETRDGSETVPIFECKQCGRLSAVPMLDAAA
jgi:hypothetical protein